MNENGKKVLIVEDEPSLANALKGKLEQAGFVVILAKNGEEGISATLAEKPDCILLDIIMPRMDGMTMLKKIREYDEGKDIKIIMLTNLSDAEFAQAASESGVYDFLVKTDWKIDDVVRKVKEKLES